MANNLIQIKRTSVSGRAANTTTLSNPGELALNMADGILYSGNGTAVFEIGANTTNSKVTGNLTIKGIIANGSLGTSGYVLKSNGSAAYWDSEGSAVGAANQILYRNSSNVLTSSSGLVYDGTSIKVNGNLESVYNNGSEGGEIFLSKPASGTTLAGTGVTLDIYENKLRIFENGGTNRGAYIDITAASAGVGSDLLSGGGGGGSVNVSAQYAWTNTHSFSANVAFTGNNISVVSNTGSILLGGASDTNWRIGRSTGAFTKRFYTNNSLDFIAANSNLEGIAFGYTGSEVYLETGYNGTFTKNPIYVSTINSTSVGVQISNSSIIVGNSSITTTINSTSFTGTANNSSYLGGTIASSFVQNTDSRTLSGNLNFTGANTNIAGNLTIASTGELIITNGAGIIANGTLGTADQVLTTNGSSVYWSTSTGGSGFTNGQSISVNNFVITGAFSANSSNGTSGQILVSGGANVYWSNAVLLDVYYANGDFAFNGTGSYVYPRVNNSITISTPLAWNSDLADQYVATAQAANLTISADSGSPLNGQKILFRIKDNGTSQTLTWTTGASKAFRTIGTTLPSSTTANKTLYVGAIYNADDLRWDVIAVSQEV